MAAESYVQIVVSSVVRFGQIQIKDSPLIPHLSIHTQISKTKIKTSRSPRLYQYKTLKLILYGSKNIDYIYSITKEITYGNTKQAILNFYRRFHCPISLSVH